MRCGFGTSVMAIRIQIYYDFSTLGSSATGAYLLGACRFLSMGHHTIVTVLSVLPVQERSRMRAGQRHWSLWVQSVVMMALCLAYSFPDLSLGAGTPCVLNKHTWS